MKSDSVSAIPSTVPQQKAKSCGYLSLKRRAAPSPEERAAESAKIAAFINQFGVTKLPTRWADGSVPNSIVGA
jgi:hypothetical protein